MPKSLDLAAACEAFVAVADRESFTSGAAAVGVSQSVASRRVAALEAHLGGRLFERSSRRVALTAFGRSVLPSAVKLVTAAGELADDAGQARNLPIAVAVPHPIDGGAAAAHAIAAAAAATPSMRVEAVSGTPRERAAWLSTGRAQLAFEHVEPDRASWSAPLGVGTAATDATEHPFFLAAIRPRRGSSSVRRIRLQPEDDVPQVRDRLERARNGAGLSPGQLAVERSLTAAVARVIADDDLVLCTSAEARALRLTWHPLGDLHLRRGYALAHRDHQLARRFTDAVGDLAPALVGAVAAPLPAGIADPTTEGAHRAG
ncbi:LysR family transcriptional regulator [Agromyces intestinalis]|nr:LysR family transcriptional regulator [Agromyces intestinalis]